MIMPPAVGVNIPGASFYRNSLRLPTPLILNLLKDERSRQPQQTDTAYRLVYWGARRARFSPYFLLSLMRASRVTSPRRRRAAFSSPL